MDVVRPLPFPPPPVTQLLDVPGERRAIEVRGLKFERVDAHQALSCHVDGGTVAFERCGWLGAESVPELLRVGTSSVLLRDCELPRATTDFSCNPALRCDSARVVAIDTTFGDGDYPSVGEAPQPQASLRLT